MDWEYAFFKCADKSVKGISQLKLLKALKDVFNLDDFLAEEDLPVSVPDAIPASEDERERISRYNKVKEQLLQQIIPVCICLEYYQEEFNNSRTQRYVAQACEAVDLALTSDKEGLEQVLEQNPADYDTTKATALVFRYAAAKGFLKLRSAIEKTGKSIYLLCPVRKLTEDEREFLVQYVDEQEAKGNKVHYPPRDTNQEDPHGLDICMENREAVRGADEVHIYWNATSSGSGFDFGMAFMIDKPIKFINKDKVPKTPHKSFENVLHALDELYGLA